MKEPEITRRVSLTNTEIEILIGLCSGFDGEIIKSLHERFIGLAKENADPEFQRIRKAFQDACQRGHSREGEREVDADCEVSLGDDSGAYVMTWTWVSDDDANLCRARHAHYEDGGDGFDGECPSCADKTAAAEEGEGDE